VAEAERAVKLAPTLAEAQSSLGYALAYGRLDVRGAAAPYEAARKAGQGDADVLTRYAQYATRTGDFAAAKTAVDRVLELDPLNARVWRSQGSLLFSQKRYAESIAPAEKALSINPRISLAHSAIGDAQYFLKQLDQAIEQYRLESTPVFRDTGLAIVLHKGGDTAGAEAALRSLVTNGDSSAYQQAQVFAQWEQPDEAFAALDRALRIRDSGLLYLRNDPMMDSLRANPRFTAIMRQVGFA
jgi:tetratricopeptide (TPR) repeat protein